MKWIEVHGIECLIIAYIFSLCASVMPPMPPSSDRQFSWRYWWATWLYNVVQVFGANLGNLVKHSPIGQTLETTVGVSTTKTATLTATTEVSSGPKA